MTTFLQELSSSRGYERMPGSAEMILASPSNANAKCVHGEPHKIRCAPPQKGRDNGYPCPLMCAGPSWAARTKKSPPDMMHDAMDRLAGDDNVWPCKTGLGRQWLWQAKMTTIQAAIYRHRAARSVSNSCWCLKDLWPSLWLSQARCKSLALHLAEHGLPCHEACIESDVTGTTAPAHDLVQA